jgi:hypothetical protein
MKRQTVVDSVLQFGKCKKREFYHLNMSMLRMFKADNLADIYGLVHRLLEDKLSQMSIVVYLSAVPS